VQEQEFRFVDVADAAGHALVEQYVGHGGIGFAELAGTRRDRGQIGLSLEQVHAQPGFQRSLADAVGAEDFAFLGVEADVHLGSDHQGRGSLTPRFLPWLRKTVPMPGSIHAQVRPQRDAMFKGDEQMLAARRHRVDAPTAKRGAIRGLELYPLGGLSHPAGCQGRGQFVDGVAFGHSGSA